MRTIAMYCDEYVDLVNELDWKKQNAKVMFSREAGSSQYDVYVARMDK